MRIIPRNARGLALCLALAGCSTQPEFEVDRTADFSSFDSFSVNSAEIPVNHQSLQGHVDSAIAAQLTS
jgi:starvation-inducible outer membrane lipoprotein